MSCVAEQKAIIQKAANVVAKKNGRLMQKATLAIVMAIKNCIVMVHQRLLLIISTNGAQNGFITHGRYSHAV